MAINNLKVKRYKQEGSLAHEYNALRVVKSITGELGDLTTNELQVSAEHPIDLQCQPSYDGTVNLIINDDVNPPRIINTRFTKLEDNQYKIITRNQYKQTNIYNEGVIDMQTRLFRNVSSIPKIDLVNVYQSGQLMGGNYTFYIKYADNDYNKTDVVAESGLVSIFSGNPYEPKTVSGTLMDQRTDKTLTLALRNVDTSFAYFYVYFRRNTSDLNGVPINKVYMISKPFKVKNTSEYFTLTGYEDVIEVDEEELNVKYNICTAVKTQAQVQNMLFFGNVQQTIVNNKELQNLSYFIEASWINKKDSIGYLSEDYEPNDNDDVGQVEYYNPLQTYYSLGYWPEEIYRFGVVYIFTDDSLSPVYNLRGCKFSATKTHNFTYGVPTEQYSTLKVDDGEGHMITNYLPKELMIGTEYLDNTSGIFQMPDYKTSKIYRPSSTGYNETHPLGIQFRVPMEVMNELSLYNVKGVFFVRQQRIPCTYAQGLSVGIDGTSFIPMLKVTEDDNKTRNYYYESFLSEKQTVVTDFASRFHKTENTQGSGLICPDADVNTQLQSVLDGSEFHVEPKNNLSIQKLNNRHFVAKQSINDVPKTYQDVKLVYIPEECALRYIDKYGFSTKVGSSMEVKQFGFVGSKLYEKPAYNFVRGNYATYIGVLGNLSDASIYSIKIPNYSETYLEEYFKIRANDNSPFYSISPRFDILNKYLSAGKEQYLDIDLSKDTVTHSYTNAEGKKEYIKTEYVVFPETYRGDCYTNTVTIRMNTNFVDADVPINDIIVDPSTWKKNYKGFDKMLQEDWNKINRADINTVPMGHWVTFKLLSSNNLGLRSEDRRHVEEMALLGNPRGFYPIQGLNVSPSGKMLESHILNLGYSTSTPFKRYSLAPDVPYIKDVFDTRIMFSDIQAEDDFRNAYRVFQGLAYKDVERQYGAIVKLLPLGANLFCVFEHGCAIIPVNEKALMSTTTGQSIHLYGAGVLQSQVTVVSPDYGSIWKESIIRTPNGIYGVDSVAKKIWCYNQTDGFVCISDQRVQRFLNDNIILSETDLTPIIAARNIKTHYNNFKGDVMFTFYNEGKTWNLCYNERTKTFVTKYSWTPCYSENIDNIFYSLDKERAELLGILWDNQNGKGLSLAKHENNDNDGKWSTNGNVWNYSDKNYINTISYSGSSLASDFDLELCSLSTSYLKGNEEIEQHYNSIIRNGSFIISDENELVLAKLSGKTLSLYQEPTKNNYYFKLEFKIKPYLVTDDGQRINMSSITDRLVIVKNYRYLSEEQNDYGRTPKEEYALLLQNGFFVHGQAGLFDEIDNLDLDQTNNITPTKWYNKQEPFEFEFVVNAPTGLHKIFDNLVIISNNVEPDSMEIEIVGDVYDFNKEGILNGSLSNTFRKIDLGRDDKYYQTEVTWDNVLNQYKLKVHQDFLNTTKYGRRLGNIQYVEDSWKAVIQPIYYNQEDQTTGKIQLRSTKIRDKWAKIRIKYSGQKLAVILAIQTLLSLSYS